METNQNFEIEKVQDVPNDPDTIILTSKPIKVNRSVTVKQGPGGIPIIRELIVIETEASASRLLALILGAFVYAFVFQMIISAWQFLHPKSNYVCITSLLFLFPPFFALYMGDVLFALVYLAYISLLIRTLFNILRRPMRSDVPKRTYRLFKMLYRICYVGSLVGQGLMLIGFFLGMGSVLGLSLTVLLISLYYGLLTRESMYFISEKMAINMGYYAADGVPGKIPRNNVCMLCDSVPENKTLVSLSCGHGYHEECIKGWVFMGKKGFCPCCRENVDFGRIKIDMIERGENMYSKFVDMLRHMIVFLAFFVITGLLHRDK